MSKRLELREDNASLSVLLIDGVTVVSVWDAWANDGQALADFMQPHDAGEWHTHCRSESSEAHGDLVARSNGQLGVIVEDPAGFSEVVAQLQTIRPVLATARTHTGLEGIEK
tara:strand:+ start:5308 stop:5643 length:336 start_codon:yes stop_codon:yes gene_type:complete